MCGGIEAIEMTLMFILKTYKGLGLRIGTVFKKYFIINKILYRLFRN